MTFRTALALVIVLLSLTCSSAQLSMMDVGPAALGTAVPLTNLRITNTGDFRITNTGDNRAVFP